MHVKLKNLPKLHLANLLRRRKTTLEQFIKESGIVAYGALVERCTAMGVQAPTEEDYLKVVPVQVTSQQDGVVVIEPPPPSQELLDKIQEGIDSAKDGFVDRGSFKEFLDDEEQQPFFGIDPIAKDKKKKKSTP